MKKPFLSSLVFGLVLAVLSSGCATMAGAIIGGSSAPTIHESTYLVTHEQLHRLSYRTEVIVYTTEGLIFSGKYAGSNPPNIDAPLSGVTIKMRDNVITIPWGNIERVEAKEIDTDKGVLLGIATGAAIDVVVFILIMKNWGSEFSPDWDGL